MNFDHLAPHYRWLEFLFAGRTLHQCRTAWLADEALGGCRSVLIVGEGDGRFLTECALRLPEAEILCVDGSEGMLAAARKRLEERLAQAGRESRGGVTFQRATLPDWVPPAGRFDLIVTHFFLDCFPPEDLEKVIRSLRDAAQPGALWLLADFRVPEAPLPARLRAQAIIAAAYSFFRLVAGLKVGRLADPFPLLETAGFRQEKMRSFSWGMLYSSLWRRAG